MSFVESEIASQPSCWRRAIELVDAFSYELPFGGDRVAVVGCGTSLYVAQAYAARREARGHGETDAFPASEFPARRRYDRVVAVTRSGTTTEVVDLLAALRPQSGRVLAITASPGSPVATVADHVVVLDHAAEQSVVQTRFATTALAFLRAGLGDPDLDRALVDVDAALAAPLPGPARHLTFLGSGWVAGLAQEAALKCRESAGMWAEAYPAMEYRHGPISVAGPETLVWALGPLPPGLADQIASTGALLVVAELEPLAELVRIQRFAVASALAAGLDPDHPRNLSYSVIL